MVLEHLEESPSSRRAWIEIVRQFVECGPGDVALLAEGVDRNQKYDDPDKALMVALLAEGVDRNIYLYKSEKKGGGRPPRGGRG